MCTIKEKNHINVNGIFIFLIWLARKLMNDAKIRVSKNWWCAAFEISKAFIFYHSSSLIYWVWFRASKTKFFEKGVRSNKNGCTQIEIVSTE